MFYFFSFVLSPFICIPSTYQSLESSKLFICSYVLLIYLTSGKELPGEKKGFIPIQCLETTHKIF